MSSWTDTISDDEDEADGEEKVTEEVEKEEESEEESMSDGGQVKADTGDPEADKMLDGVEPSEDIESVSDDMSESEDTDDDMSDAKEQVSEDEQESEVSDPVDEEPDTEVARSDGDGSLSDISLPDSAMTVQEAAERERRWKMMVWGPPGLFKSHLCFTAPEPIAFIDTEGKAHDIADKFGDKLIAIWQPSNFKESQAALHDALEWLEGIRDQTGEKGTIVIDSMSVIWEWAQFSYVDAAYPTEDAEEKLEDVFKNLNLDDWKWIKNKHNGKFRQVILDSDFHFIWTAGEKVSVNRDTGKNEVGDEGEKNNEHSADTIIRARKDSEGVKVGDMVKSNFTDRLFMGLERPTFDKVVHAVELIEEAEKNPGSYTVAELNEELGLEVVRQDPRKMTGDDDE